MRRPARPRAALAAGGALLGLLALAALVPSSGCHRGGHAMIAYDDTEVRPPRNLRQAMNALDRLLSPEDIARLRSGEIRTASLHLGLGMALRNNWGLWHRSALARWFNRRGVYHPDDMSSIILTSYVRRLRGEPLELEERIEASIRYWRDQEMEAAIERHSGPIRGARVRDRLMGWRVAPRDAPTVDFPERPKEELGGRIARFEPYRGGVVVFVEEHRDHVAGGLWYREVRYIAGPEEPLRPLARAGCPELHDLLTVDGVARWLCREDGRWSLIHEERGGERHEALAIPADSLRLGSAGADLLILSDRAIYREEGGAWVVDVARETPWFPVRATPPRRIGDALYFMASDWGDFYRLDLGAPKPTLTRAWDFLSYPFYGPWAMSVVDVAPSPEGGLWVTLGHRYYAALAHLDRAGAVRFAIFEGEVAPSLEYEEGLLTHRSLDAAALREQLPAVSLAVDGDRLYLAGDTGIAVARGGTIEWLARFPLPVTSVEGAGARRGDPMHLALFGADTRGSAFLLGSFRAVAVVYPRADGRLVAASPPAGPPLTIGAPVAEASPARAP